MVELRKRKEAPPAPPAATKKSKSAKEKATPATKPASAAAPEAPEPAAPSKTESAAAPEPAASTASGVLTTGSTIDNLSTFGGEVQTNDEKTTTLGQLLESSKSGVVLFTYPKASTPGCTTQACLFRDDYTPLTGTGFEIYGLSNDSPKSNTTFKTKQELPFTLLCDTKGTLIKAIGMGKPGNKTQRGVFVVDKQGQVLTSYAGGPAATVDVVKKLLLEKS